MTRKQDAIRGPILRRLERSDTENARLHCFLGFIKERESIRRMKEIEQLPRPWTRDPIFEAFHFCNVRRADDRVTKFIGQWAKVQYAIPEWFAYCIARWINQPDTLDALTPALAEGWDKRRVLAVLKKRADDGPGVFRGSYIINSAFAPGVPKYKAIVKEVLHPLFKKPPAIAYHSIEACWKELLSRQGFGSFMAGQVVADWQTFGGIDGMDVMTWAPLGPGSKKGLQFVFRTKMNQERALVRMRQAKAFIEERDETLKRMKLTLHDVQNCFCEFSKYVRGYSKTKYEPHDSRQGRLDL
jgi:hypothetical protein